MSSPKAAPDARKDLGAYYTPDDVAKFLTAWAVRRSGDTVLDPSAGAGVFLRAAAARLAELGGSPARQVRGVELSATTCRQTGAVLARLPERPTLIRGDFFDQEPASFGTVSAVVGNPPFIRYQRFSGDVRQKALRRAGDLGVTLSELCSSWAPFLVHATQFIERGGRLAVVAPAELVHATYARPVLRFLLQSFANIRLIVFDRKVFANLAEDTVLLLGDGRAETGGGLTLHRLDGPESLEGLGHESFDPRHPGEDTAEWTSGVARFVEHLLPRATRELYRELGRRPDVVRLGAVADVGIGYVTGSNEFFHLSAAQAADLGIPQRFLCRSLRNARNVEGLLFTGDDWRIRRDAGEGAFLLKVDAHQRTLPPGLRRYLERGIRSGVAEGYKCRTRRPWYSVPHVYVGDAFLTYMSGKRTRLFANEAKACAPNTLHVVRCRTPKWSGARLAVSWQSAVTELSCEIEGHSLGGGMLKLEPRESARVLVPSLACSRPEIAELDAIARRPDLMTLAERVDGLTRDALGLAANDVRRLREAAELLRNRRSRR